MDVSRQESRVSGGTNNRSSANSNPSCEDVPKIRSTTVTKESRETRKKVIIVGNHHPDITEIV